MSKWETVTDSETEIAGHETSGTERLKVPGGWLYRTIVAGPGSVGVALCFVPNVPVVKKLPRR